MPRKDALHTFLASPRGIPSPHLSVSDSPANRRDLAEANRCTRRELTYNVSCGSLRDGSNRQPQNSDLANRETPAAHSLLLRLIVTSCVILGSLQTSCLEAGPIQLSSRAFDRLMGVATAQKILQPDCCNIWAFLSSNSLFPDTGRTALLLDEPSPAAALVLHIDPLDRLWEPLPTPVAQGDSIADKPEPPDAPVDPQPTDPLTTLLAMGSSLHGGSAGIQPLARGSSSSTGPTGLYLPFEARMPALVMWRHRCRERMAAVTRPGSLFHPPRPV